MIEQIGRGHPIYLTLCLASPSLQRAVGQFVPIRLRLLPFVSTPWGGGHPRPSSSRSENRARTDLMVGGTSVAIGYQQKETLMVPINGVVYLGPGKVEVQKASTLPHLKTPGTERKSNHGVSFSKPVHQHLRAATQHSGSRAHHRARAGGLVFLGHEIYRREVIESAAGVEVHQDKGRTWSRFGR